PRDREVVGLIASSLAYGRVQQILRNVAWVLERLTPSPAAFLEASSIRELEVLAKGFRHRFTTEEELALLLKGMRGVIRRWDSLYQGFCRGIGERDTTFVPALSRFVDLLAVEGGGRPSSLLPDPKRGSACKRLHLFLRWMVRKDAVDPGGWEGLGAHRLIIPLDTHMHNISLGLGLTQRRHADLKAALEITHAFRRVAPEDPVRYDFVLTRWGIREELSVGGLLEEMEDIKEG
ncbi:MAG: TIGR02757 family protein, partial [Aquificota bacterium]